MLNRSSRSLLIAGALFAAAALAPGGALADTMVYVKGGYPYVANADGAGARTVTSQQSSYWAWPSESDTGTIAVAGGAPGTDGTTESSGSTQIFAFDQQGNALLSAPATTPASYSSPGGITNYVTHFRISPDATKVAYTDIGCCGASGETTFISALQPGSGWTQYMDDFIDPEWVAGSAVASGTIGKSTALLLSHNGQPFSGQFHYGFFDPADNTRNLGWVDASADNSDFEATVSRGTLIALVLDDASDTATGLPQNVRIHLETFGAGPGYDSTDDCTITLPAAQFQRPHDLLQISPALTSDGRTLAWGQADGIYEANVADPTNCGAVTGSVHLVVPGGAMPSFSPAALSALRTPGPGPTPGPTPGGGLAPGAHGAPTTGITRFALQARRHLAQVRFAGSGRGRLRFQCRLDRAKWRACRSPLTLRHLHRGRHVLRVRAVDARGRVDPTPAAHAFRLSR
jgi:hypothetical protein